MEAEGGCKFYLFIAILDHLAYSERQIVALFFFNWDSSLLDFH